MAETCDTVRVRVPVGDEDVTFICRRPSGKALSTFLNSRFVNKRNKMVSRLYEARTEFVDSILTDVENVTFRNAADQSLPLNRQTELTQADREKWATILDLRASELTWKDLLPINWKSSVAMYFEDATAGGEEGN